MENTDLYLEPVKYYKGQLKDQHHQNVVDCFDNLVKTSGINEDENRAVVAQVKKKQDEKKAEEKKLGKAKVGYFFLMFFGILLAVAIIGIFLLIKAKKFKNERIKTLEAKISKIDNEIDQKISEAEAIISPLTSLFRDTMATELMEKTAPLLDFDPTFREETMVRLVDQFGEKPEEDNTYSTLVIQSGNYNANPFVLKQSHHMWWGTFTYTGTLVITWTSTYSDSNGTHTQTHTQTLVAHVTKPIPEYGVQTTLNVYSEIAPKLSFTRTPTEMYKMNEKQIEKYIAKTDKENEKKAQKALKKGETYTKVANSKFEAYWNATDRTNEMEYRLLFTPLAQTNICYQMSQSEPFGDDINYVKHGMINTLWTAHDQGSDYSGGVYNYMDYNIDVVREKFITYNDNFFRNLYYDFITLLSIPVFHQQQSSPYTKPITTKRNISAYETEVIINKGDEKLFQHPETDTAVILKTEIVSKGKDFDMINVHAHSFKKIPQVEIVPTLGGDGKLHPVPVPYFIYEPIEQVTPLRIDCKANDTVAKDPKSVINYRGISLVLMGLVAKEIDKDAK